MRLFKRLLSGILITGLILTNTNIIALGSGEESLPEITGNPVVSGYSQYLDEYSNFDFGEEIVLSASEISVVSGGAELVEDKDGNSGVKIPDTGAATWRFTVSKDSIYICKVEYISAEKGSGSLEVEFLIDGKVPFDEVSMVTFTRLYKDVNKEFLSNASGNDILPEQEEVFEYQESHIKDQSGYINGPLKFYFAEGEHEITFVGSRGSIIVSKITLTALEDSLTYEEYIKDKKEPSSADDAEVIRLEAEHPDYKNSITLLPDTDRNSSATSPQNAFKLKLNVLGNSWKNIGEMVTYKFHIEKSGFYEIAVRFKQDTKDGIFSSRSLLIDGELPFKEAESLRFYYDRAWQYEKLGNKNTTFQFYFEQGDHEISFSVVNGDSVATTVAVAEALNELYAVYRRIVVITGSSPDVNRDYRFQELIPNEIEKLGEVAEKLQIAVDIVDKEAGENGSYTALIKKLIFQLETMHESPKNIAKQLERFRSNLGSLGAWLLTAKEQPLAMDYIDIVPVGTSVKNTNGGFFEDLWFAIQCFFASFITDYARVGDTGNNSDNKLTIWIQSGRDQGEIIRQLIDSYYRDISDCSIELEIVAGGSLLSSIIAGESPDIVFDNGMSDPVDYALRNAVVDFNKFEDCKNFTNLFPQAALDAATLEGGLYGIPQTFDYYMFFYRTDIFEEYGFEVPKTWQELIDLIPNMQRNGLEVGIPHDLNAYAMFLEQNQGRLYKDGGASVDLGSKQAIDTFCDFTELYTLYNLPVTFDFSNRFRTGEMACGIQMYSAYNQLTAFAPEIKGKWEMVPVPGVMQENGTIDNTSMGTCSYIMMMNSCKNQEEAWKFIKWFMSTEIQSQYAVRMESILGTCAKITTANVEALGEMTWNSKEYKNLWEQLDNVATVPQVPGGYYMSRILGFAFNRVYNSSSTQNMGEEPAEVLVEYIDEINQEIERKRKEFGLWVPN